MPTSESEAARPAARRILLTPAQAAFLDADKPFVGFVGGIGSGKSFVLCYDLLKRARPGGLYMVAAPTFPMLRDATLRSFLDVAERTGTAITFHKSEVMARLSGTGAEILFRSADDPERMRGPNLSGICLDEASLMHEDTYTVAIGRLRQGGRFGFLRASFTPKGRLHWTHSVFARGNPDTALIRSRTADNPFLAAEFEETVRRQYGEGSRLAEQELAGEFVDWSGGVFQSHWFKLVAESQRHAARVRYWDKACLVGGTMVETALGPKPIESVTAGEMVLTRAGYRRVTWAGQTKITRDLVAVGFANGSKLVGTPDHLVWTENRGWVPLSSVACGGYNSCITAGGVQWGDEARQSVPTRRSACSGASGTPGGRAAGTSKRPAGTPPGSGMLPRPYTRPFGSTTAGRSRPAVTSTTGTATRTITASPIWSALLTRLIADFTGRLTPSTIAPPPAGTTARSSGWRGRKCPTGIGRAGNAGRDSGPDTPTPRGLASVAQSAAGGSGCERGTGAVSAVPPGSSAPQRRTTAPVAVRRWEGPPVPVFDLTVEGEHEFFANGILVHNSTEDGGCYTAGVLVARPVTGGFVVEDVVRGRWSAHQRDAVILQTARLDKQRSGVVTQVVEQEPGSGGKESAEATARLLAGFHVKLDKVTDPKGERYLPLASQAEAGNVSVLDRPWAPAFLEELAAVPEGKYVDQADAASGAFAHVSQMHAGGPGIGLPNPGQETMAGVSDDVFR